MKDDTAKTIRSVVRALSVLNVIGGQSKGISAISKELDLSKGTVFDLIKTLEHMDYVIQDQQDDRYRLGPALLRLAVDGIANIDIVEVARPYLQALSDEIGEVAHLGKREGFNASFLLRTTSRTVSRMLDLNSQVGALSPLHCTSMGKVFLAYMSDAEAEQFLERQLTAYTDQTIVSEQRLQEERTRIRERGYSLNIGEFEEGVSSIAVPLRDATGKVVAGINIAMPSVRMPEERIAHFYAQLKATAERIEKELGA
ncbi:IclR family transcriptional regulator [Phytopseudomonas daroniae]|uniref:IclR family transcriptional regulator n=1 Tax=Phytopseudomonas daroniae TaxID=2487519 RepID=UPI00103854E4|nr:IclR family transcriptional regulator [Pseudomonas daroniae]TBU76344.1 hypothetical protein DNK10_10265 [Pseudomonas daroniae]